LAAHYTDESFQSVRTGRVQSISDQRPSQITIVNDSLDGFGEGA
jgi:hypothetical protein